LFLLLLCASAVAEPAATAPVKIGAIYGFTGFANIWSAQARRGIELARDEINASGGVHGRPVEIIFEDSGTTAQGAVSAFNKLVKSDHVEAVVGDIISFVTLPLVPLAQSNKVVLVTPSIFDTDLPPRSEYFFTTCPRTESIAAPVEKFFSLNRGIKKIAIICADNTWGRTYLDVWRKIARAHIATIVDENCITDYTTDMRAGIDRALKRMKELNFTPKVLTTSDLDEAIHSRGFPASEAEGIFFADWLPTVGFSERFRARFNERPLMAPQNSYEAVRVVVEGLRRNERDLEGEILALHYDGDAGPVDFRGSRAGNRAEASLMVVSNGEIRPVGQ
jgi:ABC-type branched-subunit amino acid transport system substrate-binding protein